MTKEDTMRELTINELNEVAGGQYQSGIGVGQISADIFPTNTNTNTGVGSIGVVNVA